MKSSKEQWTRGIMDDIRFVQDASSTANQKASDHV